MSSMRELGFLSDASSVLFISTSDDLLNSHSIKYVFNRLVMSMLRMERSKVARFFTLLEFVELFSYFS